MKGSIVAAAVLTATIVALSACEVDHSAELKSNDYAGSSKFPIAQTTRSSQPKATSVWAWVSAGPA
jgi:hypothetical protein